MPTGASWPSPDAQLQLTDEELDQLVAFLHTCRNQHANWPPNIEG